MVLIERQPPAFATLPLADPLPPEPVKAVLRQSGQSCCLLGTTEKHGQGIPAYRLANIPRSREDRRGSESWPPTLILTAPDCPGGFNRDDSLTSQGHLIDVSRSSH